jgi:Fur family ferric uptake transcriptional regulator
MNKDLDIKTMLKNTGLYCTNARITILQVLAKTKRPLSQDQIARCLSAKPDKVTIYRTLTSLLKADLVHRAYVDERAAYYELSTHCSKSQCHPHFTCTQCGRTHCLRSLKIPMAKSPHQGFLIQRQKVRLEGLCPACT